MRSQVQYAEGQYPAAVVQYPATVQYPGPEVPYPPSPDPRMQRLAGPVRAGTAERSSCALRNGRLRVAYL